jgi:putative peptide zinc metalloprotease protein
MSTTVSYRPLPLRARPDLLILPQRFGRDRYWLVKDPVALRYYHLRDEEHAILELLDGRMSLAEIRQEFEARFAPWRLPGEQLYAFVGRLHEMGLLVTDTPGQGGQLLERLRRQRSRGWIARLTNVLAIRFPGVNPEPLLRRLDPACRGLFSQAFLTIAAAVIAMAAGLVAGHFLLLKERLPDFHAFFTAENILALAAVMAGAKVVHELAHAVTCRHFGGECREVGLLLLVFTPCLYCNVTDAWTFPGKWQRMAVAAAGIAAELLLASIATLLWWHTAPGLLNTLCLNVMVVCSVSTVIFNGNPLLRYDGYYLLADWLEVPNLGPQSAGLLHRTLARWTLGIELPPDRWLPPRRRVFLMAYAVASAIYRIVVLIGVLWLTYRVLASHGLQVVAQAIVLATVIGAVVLPAAGAGRWLFDSARRPPIRRGKAALNVCLLLLLLAGLFFWPVPRRVSAPAVLEPRGGQRVYVLVSGRLEQSMAAGDVVRQGQDLARLVNLELHQQTAELEGQCRKFARRLADLRLRQSDPAIAAQILPAEAALADCRDQLSQRKQDEERLVLRAPIAGVVLPPPAQEVAGEAGELLPWQGSPLDEKNRGCFLEEGTLFCLVGSPTSLEAWVMIDQADVHLVQPGQTVRMQWDFSPADIMQGTVEEVARTDMKFAPRELIHGSDLAVRIDEKGAARPQSAVYQARVRLEGSTADLRVAGRGRAKITVSPQPIAWQVWRYMQQTFR